jgi:hypothetical protein
MLPAETAEQPLAFRFAGTYAVPPANKPERKTIYQRKPTQDSQSLSPSESLSPKASSSFRWHLSISQESSDSLLGDVVTFFDGVPKTITERSELLTLKKPDSKIVVSYSPKTGARAQRLHYWPAGLRRTNGSAATQTTERTASA